MGSGRADRRGEQDVRDLRCDARGAGLARSPLLSAMAIRRRLGVALVATAAVALLEFWGGAVSHSLALLSDAVHVCTDVLALALALLAAIGAARPADPRRTFGYGRIEVLGALVNGTLLLVATVAIVYEAA